MTEQQKREAAVPIGAPGSAYTDEATAEPKAAQPADQGPAPAPTRPRAVDSAALFREAEDALKRRDPNAATDALRRYLDDPAAPNKPAAAQLLAQIELAKSDAQALGVFAQMTDQQFAAYRQGQLEVDFRRLDPAVIPIAQEALQRNLAEAERRRSAKKPPDAAANPPATPEGPAGPVAQAAGPDASTDPLEVLKSKGLKRAWSTWVLVEEGQLAELLDKVHDLDEKHRAAEKEIDRCTTRLEKARRQLARDEAALKRTETDADTDANSEGHQRLRQRVERSRDAVAQAEADLNLVNVQLGDSPENPAAALAEAKKLVGQIDAGYRRLAGDAEVAAALAKLGQRLGPSDQFRRLRIQIDRAPAGKPAPKADPP